MIGEWVLVSARLGHLQSKREIADWDAMLVVNLQSDESFAPG